MEVGQGSKATLSLPSLLGVPESMFPHLLHGPMIISRDLKWLFCIIFSSFICFHWRVVLQSSSTAIPPLHRLLLLHSRQAVTEFEE